MKGKRRSSVSLSHSPSLSLKLDPDTYKNRGNVSEKIVRTGKGGGREAAARGPLHIRVDYYWDWRREATANCTPEVTGRERGRGRGGGR